MTRNPGRTTGLIYLLLGILGPLRLMYIPNALIVSGNSSATASNIAAHETLFRVGIVSQLAGGVVLIFLVLALYRLLSGVDRNQAVLMVIVGGILPAAMNFFNALTDCAALILIRGADYLSVFDKPQREALAMLFLRIHFQVDICAEVLWGLWLLPLAILVYRSRFLPRFLGIWLAINGVTYMVLSMVGLMAPHYYGVSFDRSFPMLFGEVAFILWLVIKGARPDTAAAASIA